MTDMTLAEIDPKKLQQAFKSCFSTEELRDLCFELAVDYEDLPAVERSGKIRELILYFRRRGRLEELLFSAQEHRPLIPWTDPVFWEEVGNTETQISGGAPYKGMAYFDEGDAQLFFGREALTADLARLLCQFPFLAVIGASGSGKSSLVRAGLVPLLKGIVQFDVGSSPWASNDWQILVITPTNQPVQELAIQVTTNNPSSLATTTLIDDMGVDSRSLDIYLRKKWTLNKKRPLIVVDQFEELFTLCRDEDQRRIFIDNLLTATSPELGGSISLVITLRADFYRHCAQYEQLRQALQQHQVYIGQMTPDELRRTIIEPAKGEWEFEPGLVELLLHDVGDEPGRLPLLSHALLETWRRRRGKTLTLSGYVDAGGVHGAIAETAEQVFHDLNPGQQEIARAIFLRLTELGEGSEDTRRRAQMSELVPSMAETEAVTTVLQRLADARLVITDKEAVEVAHEALIREWPTLQTWLDEDRQGLKIHRRLTETAVEWERKGREPSLLYQGLRLDEAAEWLQTSPSPALNTTEETFLQWSLQKRKRERWQRIGSAVVLIGAIVGVSVLFALFQRQAAIDVGLEATRALAAEGLAQAEATRAVEEAERANSAAATAAAARNLANARWLVAAGQEAFEEQNPGLGMELVLQGLALVPGAEEKESVLANSRQRIFQWGRIASFGDDVRSYYVNPDRSRLLVDRVHGNDLFWDLNNERLLGELGVGDIKTVTPNLDESLLSVEYWDRHVDLFDSSTGKRPAYLGDTLVIKVFFSPDGELVVDYSVGNDAIYSRNGELLTDLKQAAIEGVFYGSENLIIVDFSDQESVVYETASGELINLLEGRIGQVYTSPGAAIVVVNADFVSKNDFIYDPKNNILIELRDNVSKVFFSPYGQDLVIDSGYARKSILYRDGNNEIKELSEGRIEQVYFSPLQKFVVVDYDTEPDALFNSDSGERLSYLEVGEIQTTYFSPNDELLLVDFESAPSALYDTTSGEQLTFLEADEIQAAQFSSVGSLLIVEYKQLPEEVYYIGSGEKLGYLDDDEILDTYLSPDSRLLVIVYDSAPSVVYDSISRQVAWTLEWDRINWVDFSDDSKDVLVDYENVGDTIYQADTGEPLVELNVDEILAVDTLTNNNIWLIDYKAEIDYIYDFDWGVTELGYGDIAAVYSSPDESLLLIDYGISEAEWPDRFYDTKSGWLVDLDFDYDYILEVEFRSDNRLALVTFEVDSPAVYNTATGEKLFQPESEDTVLEVDLSPDDNFLVINYKNDPDVIYDIGRGEIAGEFEKEFSRNPYFNDDSSFFIVFYLDGTSELWGIDKRGDTVLLAPLGPNLGDSYFARSGHQLAVRYLDGPAFLLDLDWLKAMNGQVDTLPIDDLVQLACQYPVSSAQFNQATLDSYLNQIEGDLPSACP